MRKATIFTGQWADLPLETVAKKMQAFGYDGLELACWGDHFDVFKGAADPAYCQKKKALLAKYGLGVWAISNHLAGQLICDPNFDSRSDGFAPAELAGKPEAKREWAIESMKNAARAAKNMGIGVVNGFTGSPIWHMLYSFPPVSKATIAEGFFEAFGNLYRDMALAIDARLTGGTHETEYPTVEDGLRGVRFIHAVVGSKGSWVKL